MTALLEANNLGKLFGMRPVLKGISLNVDLGEFVAVLGANGAGKTTLLRILATLSRPSAGSLTIAGIDALQHADRARAHIGMVSHQSLIYPDLTARENLEFFGRMYGISDVRFSISDSPGSTSAIQNLPRSPFRKPEWRAGSGTKSKIESALRRVNLWNRRDDFARTFSRGMIQRLTIARAILHDPPLLLMDEPFTGLDQASAANLSALLRETAMSDRAVIMTTHELSRGLAGVTRALILKAGKIEHELTAGFTADMLTELMETPVVNRQSSIVNP